MRTYLSIGLALFAALFVVTHCTGCFPEVKEVAAAAGYEAQQMRCVEQYADRFHIDKCRDKVKADWLVMDAGPLLDAYDVWGDK